MKRPGQLSPAPENARPRPGDSNNVWPARPQTPSNTTRRAPQLTPKSQLPIFFASTAPPHPLTQPSCAAAGVVR
jgi:hypothetical protein